MKHILSLLLTFFFSSVLFGQTTDYFGIYEADEYYYKPKYIEVNDLYCKEMDGNKISIHYYSVSNDTLYYSDAETYSQLRISNYTAKYLLRNDKVYGTIIQKIDNKSEIFKKREFSKKVSHYVLQIKNLNDTIAYTIEQRPSNNFLVKQDRVYYLVKHQAKKDIEEILIQPSSLKLFYNFLDEKHIISNLYSNTGYGYNYLSLSASIDGGRNWKTQELTEPHMANFNFSQNSSWIKNNHENIIIKGSKVMLVFNAYEGLFVAYSNNFAQDFRYTNIIPVHQKSGEQMSEDNKGSKVSNYNIDENGNLVVEFSELINRKNPNNIITETNIRYTSNDEGKTFIKSKF